MLLQAEQAPAAELVPLGEHPTTEGEAPAAGPSINLDDQLISEGEAAVERSREQIVPMARGVSAAKRKYPATREFGAWLKGSPYSKIGDQDRAALIKIGEQLDRHEAVVVEFLTRTHLVSPQLIWIELKKELQPQPTLTVPNCYYSNSADEPTDADRLADEEPTRPKAIDARPNAAPPPSDGPIEAKASAKRRGDWAGDERFDLVLLTPGKRDLKLLLADYADPNTLKRCLPLHQVMVQDVAVIITAKISDLAAVTDVLAIYGFKRPSRVLLARRPDGADVTDAEAFIIAERGVEFSEPEGGWLSSDDAVEVAQQLYPDVSSSLLVFGSTERAGWQCRTWAEPPSVR